MCLYMKKKGFKNNIYRTIRLTQVEKIYGKPQDLICPPPRVKRATCTYMAFLKQKGIPPHDTSLFSMISLKTGNCFG